MRLDLFLKTSRLIKRRVIAKEAGDKGLILVNGKISKPSQMLKIGDEITLNFRSRNLQVKVQTFEKKWPEEMYLIIEKTLE